MFILQNLILVDIITQKIYCVDDFLFDNTNKITNRFYNILKVLNGIDYNNYEITGFFNLPYNYILKIKSKKLILS